MPILSAYKNHQDAHPHHIIQHSLRGQQDARDAQLHSDPTMNFTFATFAALLGLLFTAALCAPVEHQDGCEDVRSSSLALNYAARSASVKARNASTGVANFDTSLAWMDAKDMCDPETLKKTSTPCTGKIFNLLRSYMALVEQVSGFQSCRFGEEVKPALNKLHDDMSRCVKSAADQKHEQEAVKTVPVDFSLEAPLCQYTMDRLFSFSIFTARVFAVGDPTHHSEGSAQKCM